MSDNIKYMLTDGNYSSQYFKKVCKSWARIRYVRSFKLGVAGDEGGLIDNTSKFDHKTDSFISNESKVCYRSEVLENTTIIGPVEVGFSKFKNCRVFGDGGWCWHLVAEDQDVFITNPVGELPVYRSGNNYFIGCIKGDEEYFNKVFNDKKHLEKADNIQHYQDCRNAFEKCKAAF